MKISLKLIAWAVVLAVLLVALPVGAAAETQHETAAEAVASIKAGWNLGNTLDSNGEWIALYTAGRPSDYETAWGNPVTTRAMLHAVKAAGFNAVRVPVTYAQHLDSGANIDPVWLNRVAEVIGYVLDEGMYCVTNLHHDTGEGELGWLKASAVDLPVTGAKLQKVWGQIAERFKDYDNHLLFESFNEILNTSNEWSNPSAGDLDTVNQLNQLFVDTVRATGGGNAERNLIVNTYAAAVDYSIINAFVLPNDTVQEHLIAEVHCYSPWEFTSEPAWMSPTRWKDTWDSDLEASLDVIFNNLNNRFTKNNIPLIMGEFGCEDKNNESERAKWASYFVTKAAEIGVPCFYWDTSTMRLFNRSTLQFEFPLIAAALATPASEELQITGIDVGNAEFTIQASGGVGALSYSFYILKGGKVYYSSAYSQSSKFSFNLTESGVYQLRGYVQDELGNRVVVSMHNV
ncbi:MAG: glycoside hydrolase family 5 protein [Oscillospiraceae bacterium]|nr:glycoside hydrolase family 5 protein [Oscillospiraceae bacterium]